MKATVNIIKDIASSILATVYIDLADNIGGGLFKIYTQNTWWISKADILTIDGEEYLVKILEQNISFTIQPTGNGGNPTVTSFDLPVPTYIHGTLKMAKNEVNAIKDKMGLVPFIYLYEILRDKKTTDEASAIDRETTLRIFFLNSSSFKDMLTEDVYLNVLDPLQSMYDLFIEKIKISKYFTEIMDYENIPLVNFSEEGDQKKSIFDCNLSGIELRLNAEIRKDLSCSDYTPTPALTCDAASYIVQYLNGTLIESGIIPSGSSKTIVVANPTGGAATAILKDSLGNIISTTTIPAGTTEIIIAPNATYTIKDTADTVLYTGSIISGGDLQQTIQDAIVRNHNNTYSTTVVAQGLLILGKTDIRKTDLTIIASVPSCVPYTVGDSVVSNSDDTYLANVMATDDLELPDVTHTDSDGTPITYPSAKNFTCTPNATDIFLKFHFDLGNDTTDTATIDTDSAGVYTSISDDTASGTITVSINGGGYVSFASANPLTLVNTDTIAFKRTITTAAGWTKITGTY